MASEDITDQPVGRSAREAKDHEKMPPVGEMIVIVRGTGSIGLRHLRVIRDRIGARAIAFPVRPARAASLREAGFEVIQGLDDIGALAGNPICSIVATDTARHVGDTTELLALGDVLVEKPLAPTVAGVRELEAAAQTQDRRVFVGFPFRFDPALAAVREALPGIGCLHHVRIACQSYLPDWRPDRDPRTTYSARAEDGGVLRDLAHELDYAVALFGRPRAVTALLGHHGRLGIEAEESADLLWTTEEGASISIHLDYVTSQARREVQVFGDGGELHWDVVGQVVTWVGKDGPAERRLDCERDEILRRQAAAFLNCRDDPDPSLATLDEAAFVVALSDAARRSGRLGPRETVTDWRAG